MKIRFTGQTLPASIMEIPVSSNEIKFVKSLTQKKYRDQEGAFLVEGEKMVAEAIDSSFSVLKVYRLAEVGAKAMSRLSQTATPSPALAVVGKPEGLMLEDFSSLPSRGLFLALDGIRDPGNLGTIIRLADWFSLLLPTLWMCSIPRWFSRPWAPYSESGSIIATSRRCVAACVPPEEMSMVLSWMAGTYIHRPSLRGWTPLPSLS